MKNDLTDAQLDQEITLKLPLRTLLTLGALDAPAAVLTTRLETAPQAIGSQGQYGIYAGIARADEHGPDHILEVLAEVPEKMTYDDSMKWAASIGGTLPTRKQAALLFANVPELFEKEGYWTCAQYAGYESYAWCQHFNYGGQHYDRKLNELRARAVRRLNLE